MTSHNSHYCVNPHICNVECTFLTVTVDVNVKVISAREGTFTVTCTAKGGTVLSSSLSGPGIVNYTLMLVGTRNRRGDDTYSVTTHTIYGGANGDIYSCIARNGAATQLAASGLLVDPNDSETLTGQWTNTLPCHSGPTKHNHPLQLQVPQ